MNTARLLTGSCLLAAMLAHACSKENNVNVNGGAAGAGGNSTPVPVLPDCTKGGTDPSKAGRGPKMVRIPTPRAQGSCVWVDSTEVTRAQYAAFRADATVVPGTGAAECAWNKAFADPACETGAKPGAITMEDAQPIVCVDWCDALEFCRWAGKDLCRSEAGGSGKAETSDWDDACTNGGTTTLPYGNVYDKTFCNGDGKSTTTRAAGDLAQCKTVDPYSVFDLIGNASEWAGGCTGTADTDTCEVRGGSYDDVAADLDCSAVTPVKKVTTRPTLGFRCCARE
jgi:formylglycine-generating enzyme required for sulfatase activity